MTGENIVVVAVVVVVALIVGYFLFGRKREDRSTSLRV